MLCVSYRDYVDEDPNAVFQRLSHAYSTTEEGDNGNNDNDSGNGSSPPPEVTPPGEEIPLPKFGSDDGSSSGSGSGSEDNSNKGPPENRD